MSTTKPFGTFPTPYGVAVSVYHPGDPASGDPDHVLFSMDGTAIFAGIHDKAERQRFTEDATRLGRAPVFEDYGGHVIPKVALPMPRSPAYPRVAGMEADIPIEAWTTGLLDRFRWCDRADFLLGIIGENFEVHARSHDDFLTEIYPLGISITLTAALEHLCEIEIDCIEAAALYALTEHDEWRRAGTAWLWPFRETWFRDWRDARPRYADFARGLHRILDVPSWTFESGRSA